MEYPSGPRLRFSWLIFTFSELAICPQKEAAIHKKVFLNFDNYCLSAVLKSAKPLRKRKAEKSWCCTWYTNQTLLIMPVRCAHKRQIEIIYLRVARKS
jgi:hypothetical protein